MNEQQFVNAMSYLGVAFGKTYTQNEIMLHYDFLKEYNEATLIKAIKNIIKKTKFLPKVNELIEECEACQEEVKFEILEYMRFKGYFKAPNEYDKANAWLQRNVAPTWFKNDMKRYYKMQCQDAIGTSEQLKLGVS